MVSYFTVLLTDILDCLQVWIQAYIPLFTQSLDLLKITKLESWKNVPPLDFLSHHNPQEGAAVFLGLRYWAAVISDVGGFGLLKLGAW